MTEPAGQAPTPDPALVDELKRRRRNAGIAGFITLLVVILLVFQTGNAKLKEYSFFVGAVPALIVYLIVGTRSTRGPKR